MQVRTGDPEYLPFANHLRRLNAPNHCPCGHPRPGTLHRSESALHMPMVRLDPVIGKTMRSLTAAPLHLSLGLEFSKRRGVAAQAISGKHVWRPIIRIRQSLLQEDLRCFAIARFRQIEIDGLAMSVNRAEQVHPFAGDSNESLVHVPSRGLSFYLAL